MLDVLKIPSSELLSLLVAISFAAGLNLYATVAVLGLLARFGHLPLPPGLLPLAGWPVIACSGALFVIEFFADKIPAFDLIWNALHTLSVCPLPDCWPIKRRDNSLPSTNCWQQFWAQASL